MRKKIPQSKEKRRIYGLETEYNFVLIGSELIRGKDNQEDFVRIGNAEEEFFENLNRIATISVSDNYSSKNFFSRNGSRIYLDRGGHPEVSTPESVSPRQVILYDKAAERLLEKALAETNKKILAGRKLFLFKNNTHGENTTFGCHENYGYRAKTDFKNSIIPLLIPFLVTRQIFCGAGKLWGNRFEISQRAKFIKETVSSGTTNENWRTGNSRPIINNRPQVSSDDAGGALASGCLWQRLHLILGDSNMSEYTAWLKLGTTALVLRMIEDGFIKWRIKIVNYPPWVYRRVSKDLTCRKKIKIIFFETERKIAVRQHLSPVEIQELYLKEAKKFLKERSVLFNTRNFQEFKEIIREWESVLKKLKTNPMLLKREIDWVIKRNLIAEYQKNKNLKSGHEALKMIDLQYHNIDRAKGLYYFLEKKGEVRRILREEEVEEAITNPPQDTRAKWRSLIVNFCEDNRISYRAYWTKIYFPSVDGKSVPSLEIKRLNPFYAPTKLPRYLVTELERRKK